jgi:hypothetical protein
MMAPDDFAYVAIPALDHMAQGALAVVFGRLEFVFFHIVFTGVYLLLDAFPLHQLLPYLPLFAHR